MRPNSPWFNVTPWTKPANVYWGSTVVSVVPLFPYKQSHMKVCFNWESPNLKMRFCLILVVTGILGRGLEHWNFPCLDWNFKGWSLSDGTHSSQVKLGQFGKGHVETNTMGVARLDFEGGLHIDNVDWMWFVLLHFDRDLFEVSL